MPSRTSTLLDTPGSTDGSDYISSSLSGLSRSKSTNTFIVRAYKQATQLYLTRRFKEAWQAIAPVVRAQDDGTREHDAEGSHESEGAAAPIAQSSRGTRTKVWVFYLSLIHAIIELGAEEGKAQFGNELWRSIIADTRSGKIWEHIVTSGYGGSEMDLDAEVVVNLATLLLSHMPDQTLNQARLEAYLSGTEDLGPGGWDGTSTPMSSHSASPKALQARLRILELYALHVLPENGEWESSREFVEGCGNLDEERREAFLLALEGLKAEKEGVVVRERELQKQRDLEQQAEAQRRKAEEAKQSDLAEKAELDRLAKAKAAAAAPHPTATAPKLTSTPSRPVRKPPPPSLAPPANLYAQLTSLIATTRQNLRASPRLVMFVLAFLLLAMRRDIRIRLRRALSGGWEKVQRTVGMGVKVSYV